MESQGGSSFYRIILDHHLKHAFLDIPRKFVDKHGEKLSKYAFLEVPTGEKWKVKLKRHEGRIRLRKGLRKFFNYYCVGFGHFLVFKYKGGSLFHVLIFHPSALEIDYQSNAESSSKDKEDSDHGDDVSVVILEDSNDIKEEKEADFSPEIQDESAKNNHKKRKISSSNESGQERNVTSASVMIVERAKAFRSSNPHFIVQMSPAYLSAKYMHIPQNHGKIYFKKAKNGGLYLEGENGRACFVEYIVVGSRNHVRLHSGWNDFAKENHLHVGDVCVFELINRATRTYKVTIFRIADQEETNTNCVPEALDENPSFTVSMTSSLISCKNIMRLPSKHSRRYLQYNELGENVVTFVGTSGEKWKVPYYITPSEPYRARLRNEEWKKFVLENQLQEGDICDFEMISDKVKEYKVTITRGF